jgi:4-hydroxy-3-polyprenylbenzoate decarboxylase
MRLVEELLERGCRVSLIVSDPGKLVAEHELGLSFDEFDKDKFDKVSGESVAGIFNWFGGFRGRAKNPGSLGSRVEPGSFNYYCDDDFMAPVCSGSHLTEGMIIVPCSMATLGSIANGISSSLIERAADVMLKESRRLVLIPRETPLNRIHLKNMLAVQEAGAQIVPAMPAFYHNPETVEDMVDFVVGKVLDSLKIEHNLFIRWNGEER